MGYMYIASNTVFCYHIAIIIFEIIIDGCSLGYFQKAFVDAIVGDG